MSRRQERKKLSQPIHIHDVINDSNFGELVNVTTEGMMIMTKQAYKPSSIFQLELTLPMVLEDSDKLQLGADCLWCSDAQLPGRYWCGFYIIDISELALKQLEQLILIYGEDK